MIIETYFENRLFLEKNKTKGIFIIFWIANELEL